MLESHLRGKFFLYISFALLLIVLLGFSRTFYLRAFFDVPAIPLYVYAHGAALTAWFIWFCVQTIAVNRGRVDLHRRLGAIGITIGILVLLSGAAAALGLAPRLLQKYGNIDADLPRIAGVVWGNIGMLVTFTGLVIAAVLNRQTAEIHKRLMLLASIVISLPAFGRIAKFPIVDVPEGPFAFAGLLLLLMTLAIFDKIDNGRVLRVTVVGGCAMLAILIFFGFAISTSTFGRTFVLALT